MSSLVNSGSYPDFYIILTNKTFTDVSFKARSTRYIIMVKHLLVTSKDDLDSELLFFTINIPVTPSTYFPDGRVLNSICSLHLTNNESNIETNVNTGDYSIIDLCNVSPYMTPRLYKVDGSEIKNVNICLVLAFKEIVM